MNFQAGDNLPVRQFLEELSGWRATSMEKFFTGETFLGGNLKGDNFRREYFCGATFQEVICWRETYQRGKGGQLCQEQISRGKSSRRQSFFFGGGQFASIQLSCHRMLLKSEQISL